MAPCKELEKVDSLGTI